MSEARIVRHDEGETTQGAEWLFKASGTNTGGVFDFMVGPIAYLSGPALHVHDEQHDTFYVLEGVLTVRINDDVHDLHPGDFVTIPPGVAHTFDNVRDPDGVVRAINVMTPGGLDKAFAELADAQGSSEPDAARKAAARNGITRVGTTLGEFLGLSPSS